MFKKVLVPLDGSENAERALPWVKRYAGTSKALAVLLRIVKYDAERAEAAEYLLRMERELNYAGVPTKMLTSVGPAPLTIARAALEEGCDLVVMTTRGQTKIGRWRVGGVTAQVLRVSHVPVLVVRHRTPLAKQGHLRRVVVPLDGSATAEAILPWAEALARRHKAPVLFLHVAAPGRDEARVEALRSRSGRWARDFRRRGLRASVRVERGDPAEEILRAAGLWGLIAMTTHGYGGYKRWLLGSVAERVGQAALVPVFVYRAPAPAGKRRTLEGALA